MHGETWTPDTDRLIAQLRSVERLSLREIAGRVGRSVAATSVRLRKLGVRIHGRREWSDAEVATLRSAIADGGRTIRSIARDLDRGECSVRWKMEDLGIVPGRVRRWSELEVARLKEASASGDAAFQEAAAELGRGLATARERLRSVGVFRRAEWTAADDARLRALVEEGGRVNGIAAAMGRNPSSISTRARKLGLAFVAEPQAWLACEEEALREIARRVGTGPAGIAEMVRVTARSARAVRNRLKALGIRSALRREPAAKPARAVPPKASLRPALVAPAFQEVGRARGGIAVRLAPAPKPRLSVDLGEAVARFIRERGVTTAGGLDPERETVRLVRARGYAVTGSGESGFLVDGRVRLDGLAALKAFASQRGIEVPAA